MFFFKKIIPNFVLSINIQTSIQSTSPMSQSHLGQWEEFLQFVRQNISDEQFDVWFKPLSSLGFENGILTIFAPSAYFVEQMEERYVKLVVAGFKKVYGLGTRVCFRYNQVSNDPSTQVTLAPANESVALKQNREGGNNPFYHEQVEDIDPQLNPKYTFENYCGSASNKLARSIAEAVAEKPKDTSFNPLFIFGATGVGKTHLIQAIGIRIKEQHPEWRVLYVTARLFQSQYSTAVRNSKVDDFVRFYQSIDVLIMDDIQDLIGKPGTQNTFYHIFNHLQQNRRQIIMSSDRRPSEMDGIEDRMLSRFKWRMVVELEKPDLELRRDVLSLKSRQDGVMLPADVLEFIAANVTDSIRELEGIVVSLLAHATLLNRELTVDLARNVVSNAVKITRRQVNFEMIAQHVSNYYDIDPELIFSKTRKREVSDARQMVMFMAKKHAKMPLKTIGTRLSRTHATVIYACRNIEERLPLEKQLQDDIAKIESSLFA